MPKYAYIDKDRTHIIYASEISEEDRETAFFCPNPQCNAKLYLCSFEGNIKPPYFRATKPKFGHIENCEFSSGNENPDEDKFDESQFKFNQAMEKLFQFSSSDSTKTKTTATPPRNIYKKRGVKKHPPRTLNQIYRILKCHSITETYGDKEIGDMLLDNRSLKRYSKGCFGYIIIEAHTKKRLYDNIQKQIYLTAPTEENQYTFILNFTNDNLFKKIRDDTYKNQDKIIVVAGKWESAGKKNSFSTTVTSLEQVIIRK